MAKDSIPSHKKTKMLQEENLKSWSKAKINRAKRKAKEIWIKEQGQIRPHLLARQIGLPRRVLNKWIREENWTDEFETPAHELSDKTKDVLHNRAKELKLDDREELFCYEFIRTYNRQSAAVKSGYPPVGAYTRAGNLLRDDKINEFLDELRKARNEELFIDGMRVLEQYRDIAFADITDFVDFGPHGVYLKPSGIVNGQIISEVKEGKDGQSIKLNDRMEALRVLTKYFKLIQDNDNREADVLLQSVVRRKMKERRESE